MAVAVPSRLLAQGYLGDEHWSIGPFVTYEAVSLSIDTETFLVGLALTFSY